MYTGRGCFASRKKWIGEKDKNIHKLIRIIITTVGSVELTWRNSRACPMAGWPLAILDCWFAKNVYSKIIIIMFIKYFMFAEWDGMHMNANAMSFFSSIIFCLDFCFSMFLTLLLTGTSWNKQNDARLLFFFCVCFCGWWQVVVEGRVSVCYCSCSCAHTSISKTSISHIGTDTTPRVRRLEGIDVAVCIWLHFCNLYAPLVSFSVSPFDCKVRHEDGKYKCGSARCSSQTR